MSKAFGDYLIGKTLGEGTFGKVKAATHKHSGEQVAIKILQKTKISQVDDVERVSREIHILKLVRHPNIVHLYEIIETPKQLFLIMEYMEEGELFQQIVRKRRIEEKEACRLFHQIIDAVEHIHKIGVAHRDLKPENILLDYKRDVRVVDFGLSNTFKQKQQLHTPCGSPCYAAPEMIRGEWYNGQEIDIWSCGVVLFAMVNGYLPFEDPDTPTLYRKILSGSYNLHSTVSHQAADLISHMLDCNHSTRYKIAQVRNHPWMQQIAHNSVEGVMVGVDPICVEEVALDAMPQALFDREHVKKCLVANRHNAVTTAYYLALKKIQREKEHCSPSTTDQICKRECFRVNQNNKIHQNHKIHQQSSRKIHQKENYKNLSNVGNLPSKRKSKRKSTTTIHTQHTVFLNPTNVSVLNTISQKRTRINSSFTKGKQKKSHKSVEKRQEYTITQNKTNQARQPHIENRISKKYKQQFNQSLVSRSRDKIKLNLDTPTYISRNQMQQNNQNKIGAQNRSTILNQNLLQNKNTVQNKNMLQHKSILQNHPQKRVPYNHIEFTKNKKSNKVLQKNRINSSICGPQSKRYEESSIIQDRKKRKL